MKNNGIISNALILTIGGFLAKVFSAVYRIFLTRILGGVGIGLYQLVFPFYSLCIVLATAGVPMAVSKIVSKNKGNKKYVLRKCLICFSILGLVLSFVLAVFSGCISTLQGNKSLTVCYLILAPSILLIANSSVLKGYFQGVNCFVPSSVSNILEQGIKMLVGLTVTLILIKQSVLAAVVGAVVSVVVGEVVSVIVLILFLKKGKDKTKNNVQLFVKDLLKDVGPIMLTNLILPLANFVDSMLIVNLLGVNFSNAQAVFLYGLESGAVSSLINLPTIFSFAIASVIMPNLANEFTKAKSEKLCLSIKIIVLITLPCCILFILSPNKVINLLYSTSVNDIGIDGIIISSRLLALSSLGVLFLSVNQLLSVSLQAVDKGMVTVRNLSISVMLKFVLELLFMPSSILNIYVLAVANVSCYMLTMLLNFLEVKQTFKIRLEVEFFIKVLISALIFMFFLILFSNIKDILGFILVCLLSALCYLFAILKFGFLNKKEQAMFKYKR